MTETTTEPTDMPTALKDGEPVTELIHQCYQWLVDYMVSQGQELSSIGYAPDLITAAELQVLQQGDPTLPQGPYVPEQQPPADPIIPAGATQHQIAQAIRQNTEAKARYTKRIGVINKAKKYWIKMCGEDNFEDLRDPILGLAGNTLRALVDHIFEARSCVGGHFFLANQPPPNGIPEPKLNGPVHTVSNILRNVMSSAGEAEVAGLFHNLKDGVMLRNALIEMGHPQPATPVQTDNSFAEGFANQTVKQCRSKAIDMRFYWVQDRVAQRQFHIYWQKGATNLADYFTKHHPARHHRFMRNNYLLDLHRANFADIIFVN